jgi:WD repeat-containing protein 35
MGGRNVSNVTTAFPHLFELTNQLSLVCLQISRNNDLKRSLVRDMRWRSNGQEICIAYEDGMVIVGSVDGNRLWSKDIGATLLHAAWSPSGKLLLFVTADGQVISHNHLGVRIGALKLHPINNEPKGEPSSERLLKIVAIDWYDGLKGFSFPDAPSLVIGFESGRIQLMRDEEDTAPILVDTGLIISHARWNPNGSVLAVAGSANNSQSAEVQFFSPLGQLVASLKVPGTAISSISWESSGLRLALSVDCFVYFANIRPDYHWASFGDIVVFSNVKPDRSDMTVTFWETKSNTTHIKNIKKLLTLQAAGENCVLVCASEDAGQGQDDVLDNDAAKIQTLSTPLPKQYNLILCNAIGSPVDTKTISVRPDFLTMTEFHIAVASSDTLYVWHYRTQVSKLTSADSNLLRRKEGRERSFLIEGAEEGGNSASPICSLAASARFLLVALENGIVLQYNLPSLTLENKFQLRPGCRPVQLKINSDSTKFSIIDSTNTLTFFDMIARTISPGGGSCLGEHQVFEKKDVWDMLWADDFPDLWCMTEKHRMYVFRGGEPEEPILTSGYLHKFSDLTISSILFDDLLETPSIVPRSEAHLVGHEIRSLRDMRALLSANSLRDCLSFVERNSHPRLWKLLADTALEKLDLSMAERAFVAAGDYPGIQFVKRLQLLREKSKQRAEIAAFFKKFDDAESFYLQMDRKDLALDLRMRIGDWNQVVSQLTASGTGVDQASGESDGLVGQARARVGDYYADRQQWDRAITFYEKSSSHDSLIESLYMAERYDKMINLIDTLPEGGNLLINVGRKLQLVGITEGASKAYLRAGDVKAAVDCCVNAHSWDLAIDLAKEHELPQVEGLLSRYALYLIENNKVLAAVELFHKAHRDNESARLLAQLGLSTLKSRLNPLRAKQFFVLAALDVERFRKRTLDVAKKTISSNASNIGMTRIGQTGNRAASTLASAAMTLDTLMRSDTDSQFTIAKGNAVDTIISGDASNGNVSQNLGRVFDSAWHGAEACHFYLLCQRLLYAGSVDAAMIVALRLQQYEDILDPCDIFSLIAISSFYNKHLATASRAFIRLEHLDSFTNAQKEQYANVALSIFAKSELKDPPGTSNIVSEGPTNVLCVASGRILMGGGPTFLCSICNHKALSSEMTSRSTCALCHAPKSSSNSVVRNP